MRKEVFRMENVTCQQSGVTFLDNFNLCIFESQIMGFIPIDDHGLSTFLDLMRNNLPLRDGYIYYKGQVINSWRESSKEANPISVISDTSCLVDSLTVADNVFVLRPNGKNRILHPELFNAQLRPFLEDIDMQIPADCLVENLSLFERVVIEMMKAVVNGNRLIVLSEISTLISDEELTKLHAIMRHYTQQGTAFLYISPHFEETMQICDSAALMMNGHITKIFLKQEMRIDLLIDYAREYDNLVRLRLEQKKSKAQNCEPVFRVQSSSPDFIAGLNFSVHPGECLVIQSLNKRIDEDFLDAFNGEMSPGKARFFLDGKEIDFCRNRDIAIIQELPTHSMLFPELSIFDNLCLTMDHRIRDIWRNRDIRRSIEDELSQKFGQDFFLKKIEDLGERQKILLVYQRIRLQRPRVVFIIQPFKGEDLEHRMLIWEQMNTLIESGVAVVIFALNLADTLSMADRLIRVDSRNTIMDYSQKDFADIPIIAPWLYLYKEKP